MPDDAAEYPNYGVILAVGPRVSADCPPVGARVMFTRRPSSALSPDWREEREFRDILALREEDLVAVVEA